MAVWHCFPLAPSCSMALLVTQPVVPPFPRYIISPSEVADLHVISYEVERDLIPLILSNAQYSVEKGGETLQEFDLEKIQKQVVSRFLQGKPIITRTVRSREASGCLLPSRPGQRGTLCSWGGLSPGSPQAPCSLPTGDPHPGVQARPELRAPV